MFNVPKEIRYNILFTAQKEFQNQAKKSHLRKFSETDSVLVSLNKALVTSGKHSNERKITRDAIEASRQARQQDDAVILKYSPK
jgi:hypothetical protein